MNKFEGYTQHSVNYLIEPLSCFIRISMNKFEGYTQHLTILPLLWRGCFIRISMNKFEGYTQRIYQRCGDGRVVLSGFQ